jgi:hypothetical protein
MGFNSVHIFVDSAEPIICCDRFSGAGEGRRIQPQKPSQSILLRRIVVVVVVFVMIGHVWIQ